MAKQDCISLNWVQKIRDNWPSYFHGIQPEDYPYALLVTAINKSLLNGSSIIKIILGKDGSITVRDNSKGWASRFDNLLTIRGDVAPDNADSARRILDGKWFPSYPLINALSKEMDVSYVRSKIRAHAICSRGRILSEESQSDLRSRSRLIVRFLPDPEIKDVAISYKRVEEILWGCAERFLTVSFYLNGRPIG